MTALHILLYAALALTLASLVSGVISMARGGEFDRRHGTEFMFARVGFQALTVVIILLGIAALHFAW